MSRNGSSSGENRRIDSWKEIAAFFGRDERTVKRWEKDRSLPVHRVPGSQRGGVFAYTEELTNWLNSPTAEKEIPEQEPSLSPLNSPGSEIKSEPEPELPIASAVEPSPTSSYRTKVIWAVALATLVIVLGLGISFAVYRARGDAPERGVSHGAIKRVPNPEAVEFYLKGRYYWNRRTGDSLNRSVDAFTQAIVLDPSYAEAYAGLADSYDLMREYTPMPASEAYPRAIAAANKAVALDDSLSEAHRALAFGLFYWKWEIPRALNEYQKAIRLNPNDVEAHHWYATALLNIGRMDEAFSEIESARRLNPTSPSILADRALILYWSGNHDGAIAALTELEEAEPGFLSPPRYLASLLFSQKDYPGFLAQSERAARISKDPQEIAIAEAAQRGWSAGGEHPMLEEIERTQQTSFERGQSSGFQLASTCLLLGRKKDAIRYLQAAYAAHDPLVFTVTRNQFGTELKGDPAFEELKAQLQAHIDPPVTPKT
jgi:tetratricopeptide (TPR) repeat protein